MRLQNCGCSDQIELREERELFRMDWRNCNERKTNKEEKQYGAIEPYLPPVGV